MILARMMNGRFLFLWTLFYSVTYGLVSRLNYTPWLSIHLIYNSHITLSLLRVPFCYTFLKHIVSIQYVPIIYFIQAQGSRNTLSCRSKRGKKEQQTNKQTNKQTKILVAIGVFILPFPWRNNIYWRMLFQIQT